MTNSVTIVGNLVDEVALRFIPSGAAVAGFTVASSSRVKQGDQWVDGETTFLKCNLWREAAENLAESDLQKGTRLIVTGKLKQKSWEKDGQKRTSYELDAEEVGVSLKFAQAKVNKRSKGDGGAKPAKDPWGTADDSPPF